MLLSKIKIKDILKCNNYNINIIVFEDKINYIKKPCDIGFVFGGPSMIPYRCDKAIQLYKSGYIKKILISGGIGFLNLDRINNEAYKMYNYLIKQDVPKEDIIIESKSRNTIDNINNSINLLSLVYDINNLSFILITNHFHLRRCILLLTKYINRNKIFWCGITDGKTDINSWNKSLIRKIIIVREAILLTCFARKGIISDINIDIKL